MNGYQLVGADQIVGYVPYYGHAGHVAGYIPQYTSGAAGYQIVGAPQMADAGGLPAMAMTPGAPPQQVPLGRLPYGGSPVLEHQMPRNTRQYTLGFVQLAVAASGSATVTSRPQVLFRGYRLIIPSTIATNFVLTDIRVGKNSQFVQATEIPASVFQENSFDTALTLDTAQIAADIAISVRNTDGAAAHDFRAVMFGAALE